MNNKRERALSTCFFLFVFMLAIPLLPSVFSFFPSQERPMLVEQIRILSEELSVITLHGL